VADVLGRSTRDAGGTLVVPDSLEDYPNVLYPLKGRQLPIYKDINYTINLLPDSEPPYIPLYNISARELEILRKYLNSTLEKG
jgi:hypothetical protein